MLRGLKQTLCAPGPRDPTKTESELCVSVSCGGVTREAEKRLEKKLLYNPAILLQNTYPKEVKTSTYTSTQINTYS